MAWAARANNCGKKMAPGTKRKLIRLYITFGLLTLAFQIYVRSPGCSAAGTCTEGYAKALVWSAIWPASWVVYLKGLDLD